MDSTINMVVNPSCYVFFLILACLGGIGSAQPDTASPSGTFQGRRCGYMNDCPGGQSCSYQLAISEPGCLGKGNCVAYCVDLPRVPDLPRPPGLPKLTYSSCGGFTRKPSTCSSPMSCIDNPYAVAAGSCGMACDAPGICVRLNETCSGPRAECSGGKKCFAQSRMSYCHPTRGGSNCAWHCI
jgi:hypothetical protein